MKFFEKIKDSFKEGQVKGFIKILSKEYHLSITLTETENRIINALPISQFLVLKKCLKLIKKIDRSLLSPDDYGVDNTRWLIKQAEGLDLSRLAAALEVLKKNRRLIRSRYFIQFTEVLSGFRDKAIREHFLDIYRKIGDKNSHGQMEKSLFKALLNLDKKQGHIPILNEILNNSNFEVDKFLDGNFEQLISIENVDSLRFILEIIRYIQHVFDELFDDLDEDAFDELDELDGSLSKLICNEESDAIRDPEELSALSQLLLALSNHKLLTPYNIKQISQLDSNDINSLINAPRLTQRRLEEVFSCLQSDADSTSNYEISSEEDELPPPYSRRLQR